MYDFSIPRGLVRLFESHSFSLLILLLGKMIDARLNTFRMIELAWRAWSERFDRGGQTNQTD
jgi:hypothetical protein